MADRRRRTVLAAALLAVAIAALTACDQDEPQLSGSGAEPISLVVSATYTGDASAADLARAVDELRVQTTSGWVGRQDDVTGMLGELSGGRYFAAPGADADTVVTTFLDTWGPRLLGVSAQDLTLGEPTPPTDAGSTTIRAEQRLGSVPVLDGVLVFTLGVAESEPRLNAVRGRVFGDLGVSTTPTLGARRAVARAERLSGGTAMRRPALVVVPDGDGRLAWQVTITQADGISAAAPTDGYYFVDAHSGELVTTRAASIEGRTPVVLSAPGASTKATAPLRPRARALTAADPNSVEATGTAPTGEQLTAHGVQTQDGVALVDTTVPTYDGTTREGGIMTYDMSGSDDSGQLPGRLYVADGTTVTDSEAIAAQAYSRAVYDYYAALGWASWDGKGSSLVSSIHYADNEFCNSFFNGSQMVYGNQCAPAGEPAEISELDIDTAGHEITHGVTGSTAALIYSGQSGALNESFSDYFGNIIGDTFYGSDSNAIMEHVCEGIPGETEMCHANPDGTASLRYLPNGTTFDDYFFALDTSAQKFVRFGLDQDKGGVHINSAVWNNALWTIRSRLAQMDDAPALESELAGDFDKIVFHALTTQLGPTSGFLDARRAIEQSTVESGADPVVLRVEREVFTSNRICPGCSETGPVPGQIVTNSSETETMPAVHGDRIAWLAKSDSIFGGMATGAVGSTPRPLDTSAYSVQVVFAGDSLIGLQYPDGRVPGRVLRFAGSDLTQVGESDRSTLVAGLAGSDDGAAWVTDDGATLAFVDPAGAVTTGDLGSVAENVSALGTGGGTVGIGTLGGKVIRWTAEDGFRTLGTLPGPVLSTAAYGDRVLAVDIKGNAVLYVGDAAGVTISQDAAPFGATMGEHYAVWPQKVGGLGGGAAEAAGYDVADTDLYLVSFDTGTIYSLMEMRGQQGFPALSGDRLVWQDAVYGGDDILTATIPSGL